MSKIIKYIYAFIRMFYIRNYRHYQVKRTAIRVFNEYKFFTGIYADNKIQNILLIGVALYTHHYAEFFNNKSLIYTIDTLPEMEQYGVKNHHIIDTVENIRKYIKDDSLDAVFMEGVYGWGLDDKNELIRTLENIRCVLKKGGILIFGWDKTKENDPLLMKEEDYFQKYEKSSKFGKSSYVLDTYSPSKTNRHIHTFSIYQK